MTGSRVRILPEAPIRSRRAWLVHPARHGDRVTRPRGAPGPGTDVECLPDTRPARTRLPPGRATTWEKAVRDPGAAEQSTWCTAVTRGRPDAGRTGGPWPGPTTHVTKDTHHHVELHGPASRAGHPSRTPRAGRAPPYPPPTAPAAHAAGAAARPSSAHQHRPVAARPARRMTRPGTPRATGRGAHDRRPRWPDRSPTGASGHRGLRPEVATTGPAVRDGATQNVW